MDPGRAVRAVHRSNQRASTRCVNAANLDERPRHAMIQRLIRPEQGTERWYRLTILYYR